MTIGGLSPNQLEQNGYKIAFQDGAFFYYQKGNEFYVTTGSTNPDRGNSVEDYIKDIGNYLAGETDAGYWRNDKVTLVTDQAINIIGTAADPNFVPQAPPAEEEEESWWEYGSV